MGVDDYLVQLWDRVTGKIDRNMARYAREHSYDLREYLERNWPKVGRNLLGKLRIYCGESDGNFLHVAAAVTQNMLKGETPAELRH